MVCQGSEREMEKSPFTKHPTLPCCQHQDAPADCITIRFLPDAEGLTEDLLSLAMKDQSVSVDTATGLCLRGSRLDHLFLESIEECVENMPRLRYIDFSDNHLGVEKFFNFFGQWLKQDKERQIDISNNDLASDMCLEWIEQGILPSQILSAMDTTIVHTSTYCDVESLGEKVTRYRETHYHGPENCQVIRRQRIRDTSYLLQVGKPHHFLSGKVVTLELSHQDEIVKWLNEQSSFQLDGKRIKPEKIQHVEDLYEMCSFFFDREECYRDICDIYYHDQLVVFKTHETAPIVDNKAVHIVDNKAVQVGERVGPILEVRKVLYMDNKAGRKLYRSGITMQRLYINQYREGDKKEMIKSIAGSDFEKIKAVKERLGLSWTMLHGISQEEDISILAKKVKNHKESEMIWECQDWWHCSFHLDNSQKVHKILKKCDGNWKNVPTLFQDTIYDFSSHGDCVWFRMRRNEDVDQQVKSSLLKITQVPTRYHPFVTHVKEVMGGNRQHLLGDKKPLIKFRFLHQSFSTNKLVGSWTNLFIDKTQYGTIMTFFVKTKDEMERLVQMGNNRGWHQCLSPVDFVLQAIERHGIHHVDETVDGHELGLLEDDASDHDSDLDSDNSHSQDKSDNHTNKAQRPPLLIAETNLGPILNQVRQENLELLKSLAK